MGMGCFLVIGALRVKTFWCNALLDKAFRHNGVCRRLFGNKEGPACEG